MIYKQGFMFTEDPPAKKGHTILIVGDALAGVKNLNQQEINCWITSPPYFNQFSYGMQGQVGMELSFHDYIGYMATLARAMLETSTSDANLFWVIRDTYNGSGGPGGDYSNRDCVIRPAKQQNIPRKAQLMIPERTRIAFASVGWIPILDIIWDKKDSRRGAKDRPSYSYEHVLLFSKSPQHYWNREAVLQPYSSASLTQLEQEYTGKARNDYESVGLENPSDTKRRICASMQKRPGAYLRSVWSIPSGNQPVVEVDGKKMRALTAFPVLLAEICVNLGCPVGGWVFDPFVGFGTTNIAASQWGRQSIGIDLNPQYIKAAQKRLKREV